MKTKGIYIYGIVPNFYGTTHFQSLENSGVYAITFENISAIVSDRENGQLDLMDRESLAHTLVHHQKTIEELMAKGFNMIIPMKLGTIVNSKEEVLDILAKGHNLIILTLTKIEYLTEIDLVVTWADFSKVLENIAALPEIRKMKEEMQKDSGIILKADQYKLGAQIQDLITQKNKSVEMKILEKLSPLGTDIKIHEVMNDEMVTNSAFLLNRSRREKFEQTIDLLDEEYKDSLNFKLVGPLPCYSFHTLEVRALEADQLEQARKVLGLKEQTTETELKKAYLEKAKLFHPDNGYDQDATGTFNTIRKAYHLLLEYSAAVKQSSKGESIPLTGERISENLILIKIKE
ncbi:MAG: GvpL/GvpF family gas vesicle protein [Bacteroidota bacterium]